MTAPLPCVCTTLRKASRAITRRYDEQLAHSGMTTPQFALLRTLAREGDLPLSRLADLQVMDRTSLYRTLAPLERHGWVKVAPGAHGRAKLAVLTQAGIAAMAGATAAWDAMQKEIIGAIGVDNWQALAEQLGALARLPAALPTGGSH